MNKNMSSFQIISEIEVSEVVHVIIVKTYLNMNMLRITIEIKRQTIDMQQPMYDTTVSALASVGYDERYIRVCMDTIQSSRNIIYLF